MYLPTYLPTYLASSLPPTPAALEQDQAGDAGKLLLVFYRPTHATPPYFFQSVPASAALLRLSESHMHGPK
jgi:hypothetical protein